MYTITPDSSSLMRGDENCVTITWPPGTPAPREVVLTILSGQAVDIDIRPLPYEGGARRLRFCFQALQGASRITLEVRGGPNAGGSVVLQ